jgi:hypothetical protein
MSSLVEEYIVIVRLPNDKVMEITVQAMDMYTASTLVESMTGGHSMGARLKR